MFHIFIAIVAISLCYRYGDWKNWKNYYPTILFFILSSILCAFFTYNHPLWLYESKGLNHTFWDLFICITVYPSTIMMFIPHLPSKKAKKVFHIALYVAIYTITELVANKLGYFSYHNGWNIWCSLIFNSVMFPILAIHYEKPIYGWIFAFILFFGLLFIMKIPYSCIR